MREEAWGSHEPREALIELVAHLHSVAIRHLSIYYNAD